MSIKSTKTISRNRALALLFAEIPLMPNDTLADLLDHLADSRLCHVISYFDNFIVSDSEEN
jgi:hypothetical protein